MNIKVATPSTAAPKVVVTTVPDITAAQEKKDQSQSQSENNASITVVGTWVLWITDDVFVAGTDKAIVELITAFLIKDNLLLEQICKELSIEPKCIFGEEYAALTFDKIAELALNTQSIFGLTRKELLELIKKGGKKGRKAVQQFFSDLFQQKDSTKEKDKRSRKGEHVINNGVINVYRDIMEMFLFRSRITRDGLGALTKLSKAESQIIRDCTSYFDSKTKTDIQDVLKVFIDQDTAYIDANALFYGMSISVLRESAVDHMMELYFKQTPLLNEGSRQTRPLKEIVRAINDNLLYVDQHALSIWLTQKGPSGRRTYERAQCSVESMFDELYEKLSQWIRELRRSEY